MPSFLTSIGAKIVAAVVVAIVIGGLFLMWRTAAAERDLARAQAAQLQQVNEQNQAALAKLQDDFQKAQQASATKAAETQRRQDQLKSIEAENAHAPNGDKPVSPVVGSTLDQLLEPAGAGTDQGSPNTGSR